MQVFIFFYTRLDDFNIYSSLNQQIITIIGKLVENSKPSLHIIVWIHKHPKKIEMILRN
jgi:hypothetical protein